MITFEVSDKEMKDIEKWKKKHIKKKHGGSYYSGAIGGRFTYSFIPTSIGDIGTIKCSCGEEHTFKEL